MPVGELDFALCCVPDQVTPVIPIPIMPLGGKKKRKKKKRPRSSVQTLPNVFIQKAIVQTTTGAATGVSPFVQFFFSPATTTGNLLVYVLNFNESIPPAGLTLLYSSAGFEIWYQQDAPSITLQQFTSTGSPICGCAFEIQGCDTVSPADLVGTLQTGISLTADTGPVGPTNFASEIAIAAINTTGGIAPTSPTGGFITGPSGNNGSILNTYTNIVSGITTLDCSASYLVPTNWEAVMVTFH